MYAKKSAVICLIALALVGCLEYGAALPSIASYSKRFDGMGGLDIIQMCLNNCNQCKRMFGEFFESHTCAEACLKFKGKAVINCEDIASVAPFLNSLE